MPDLLPGEITVTLTRHGETITFALHATGSRRAGEVPRRLHRLCRVHFGGQDESTIDATEALTLFRQLAKLPATEARSRDVRPFV